MTRGKHKVPLTWIKISESREARRKIPFAMIEIPESRNRPLGWSPSYLQPMEGSNGRVCQPEAGASSLAGFTILELPSFDAAFEWAARCPEEKGVMIDPNYRQKGTFFLCPRTFLAISTNNDMSVKDSNHLLNTLQSLSSYGFSSLGELWAAASGANLWIVVAAVAGLGVVALFAGFAIFLLRDKT